VAELGNRLLLVEEVLDDALEVGVVADVLGRAPARHDDRRIACRVDVREREISVPGVARLLGVGVVAVDEVVDDELQLLLRGGGDLDLVTILEQPLVGVQHFERLRGVAGEDQDLGHGALPSLRTERSRSLRRSGSD
jgi:hypothetical protein